MNRDEDSIIEQAAIWHASSLRDDMDWTGFTVWLEADPSHRVAYDELALADALLTDHREVLRDAAGFATQVANDDGEAEEGAVPVAAGYRRMRWASMVLAVSLVAMVVAPRLVHDPDQIYRTGATGQTIALADGSSIELAPHSSLTVGGNDQERMALNGGAWFDIRHNPSRPLSITAGGLEIGDIGTRFDVQADAGQVRVEVAAGEVRVASAVLVQPLRLSQGRGLMFDGKSGTAVVAPVSNDSIGEWRSGRLSYRNAPLALVATDLSRYAGVKVAVAHGLRDRQFSGTLVIDDGEAALRDLSQLMGVELRRGTAGFELAEHR